MPSKSARIAYLKRMLKRMEAEEIRVQRLIATGELSPESEELATRGSSRKADRRYCLSCKNWKHKAEVTLVDLPSAS